jgi:hypothetical protein
MKHNINCPCGNNFQISYKEDIDIDQNSEQLEKILDGSFMSYSCPECRKKHKPEFKIMIIWKSKNLNFEVLPEMDRGEFYLRKKEKSNLPASCETIIGFPEMADRLAVIKDDLEPIVIEALKYYLLVKAEENYPDKDINAWYHGKGPAGIEFHLDGIRTDEVAVMRIPNELYSKTASDYKKNPKSEPFTSLRIRSYVSVQNLLRHDALK